MKRTALTLAICVLLSVPVSADISVTLNPQTGGTDVANGVLTLDELQSATSHTYVNVGGGGLDIKVTTSDIMDNSTGGFNYTRRHTSIAFEFFATGTTNPVPVSGFITSWLDLDKNYGGLVGPFSVINAIGDTVILNTSDGAVFTLGSALTAVDLGLGNGFTDGISSSGNGNWDNPAIRFDLASMPISSLNLAYTSDWIAPTGIMDLAIIPAPGAALLAMLGLSAAGVKIRRRLA
jgi:hypothetical protein